MKDNVVYLNARNVQDRYGVSKMTIHRWLQNANMEFPQPTYFGRFRYWRQDQLGEWEKAQAAKKCAEAAESPYW